LNSLDNIKAKNPGWKDKIYRSLEEGK